MRAGDHARSGAVADDEGAVGSSGAIVQYRAFDDIGIALV
jgi:hypothetical protein